jgi:UDP-2-acetamido-3-amino-2,3-dideoxy-glucuronate N-acetyltransferase
MIKNDSQLFRPSLALIGVGNWGKNLARNFYGHGELHAICDINEATLNSYATLYPDVILTTHFDSILKNPSISKIVIATPLSTHYILAKQALLAGKDVFVEKPLCLDERQAKELADLADEKGLILMIGHILQYHPLINLLQEIIKNEELGILKHIVTRRFTSLNRNTESVLWDLAPHDISLVLSLCYQMVPQRIQCTHAVCNSHGVIDEAYLTLEFGKNLKEAQICISRMNPVKEQKMLVVGSKAILVFDDTKPWEEKLTMQHVALDTHRICGASQFLQVPQVEPLQRECSHFIECCANRTLPKTNGQEAFKVTQILQAAQKSIHEKLSQTISN